MSDCGCDKARKDLEEYLRHEVCKTQHSDITEHLENCEDCTGEHLVGLTITQKVQRACQETAPEELRLAILAKLG